MECKFKRHSAFSLWIAELIDTLWNVNSTFILRYLKKKGINRYIMECKSIRIILFSEAVFGINRYIMECKCVSTALFIVHILELIDTLWNVNTLKF